MTTTLEITAALIVAASLNGVIGKDNATPWQGELPADMAYFQRVTFNKAVIMGRKTYESLPGKMTPLKYRVNIIISRDPHYDPRRHSERGDYDDIQTFVVTSLEAAFELCRDNGWLDPIVIGGGEIYRQALAKKELKKVYLTEIGIECDGDVFFHLPAEEWRRVKHWSLEPYDDNKHPFSWDVYERAAV